MARWDRGVRAGAIAALAVTLTAPAAWGEPSGSARDGATAAPTAALAQELPKTKARRPPARIRVQPLYPYRRESLPYPTPYPVEYPGPGYVRQCQAQLVPEHRPS